MNDKPVITNDQPDIAQLMEWESEGGCEEGQPHDCHDRPTPDRPERSNHTKETP